MGVLILALSVQPACAAYSLYEWNAAVIKDACCQDEVAPDDSEVPAQGDCDGCNPFHNCSCCVAAIVLPFSPQITFAYPFPQDALRFGQFPASLLLRVDFDFWQPPRVS